MKATGFQVKKESRKVKETQMPGKKRRKEYTLMGCIFSTVREAN